MNSNDSHDDCSKIDDLPDLEDSTQFFSANQSFLSSTAVHSQLFLENDSENHEVDQELQALESSQFFSPIVKPFDNKNATTLEMDENQNHEDKTDEETLNQNNVEKKNLDHSSKNKEDSGKTNDDSNKEALFEQNSYNSSANFPGDSSTVVIGAPNLYSDENPLDFENLPETVKVLHYKPKNQKIYLVGTSHFSKESNKDVRKVIRTIKPASLMLELCRNRLCLLTVREKDIMHEAKNLDFRKILQYMKTNGVVQGFIYMFLLTASARVTNDLDMAPGGEFRNAFKEAKALSKCRIFLGDRPIDITLRRTIASMNIWQRFKMAYICLWGDEKFNEEQIENYKKKDALEHLIEELSETYPGLAKVIIEERDQYLTHSLYKACLETETEQNIVGVVGIGHLAGIERFWKDAPTISLMSAELITIPENKPTITGRFIKLSIYGAFGIILYRYALPKTVKIFSRNVVSEVFNSLSKFYHAL